MGSGVDDYQQSNAVLDDCVTFIGFVADTSVMSDRNPAAITDRFQPFWVRSLRIEMVGMALHIQSRGTENFRKFLAQITIGEIDSTQAARS